MSVTCKQRCCLRTYLPITLSYARTIHKFQGLSAGPVDKGKISNPYPRIICDPDEGKYEGSATGLFYTALSRAATLGDKHGLGSAIYFTGTALNRECITKIGIYAPPTMGQMEHFIKRKIWTDHLKNNTRKDHLSKRQQHNVIKWCTNKKISYNELYKRIQKYICK